MRCAYPTLLIALATLFAACQKDNDPQQWVEVTTESYSGAKVVVDGVAATWADGDRLRVNGTTATVSRIDGHAYIEATAVSTTGVNRALYPASLSDAALGADAATVSLPAQYRYRTDASGHQLLEIPMAARSEGGKPMHFRHLTGALVFTISNELDRTLTLDHIIVQSNLYSLSGRRNIDFSNITATAPADPVQDTDRTVMLIFDGQTLPAGDSLSVTIPIAPVDSNNRFTVTVSGHYQGTRYTFNRAQTGTGDGSLVRNQLGYATTPMNESSTKERPLFKYTLIDGGHRAKIYIKTPEEFALMAEAISNKWRCPATDSGYHAQDYHITADIDMQGHTLTPISSFRGEEFNGNGHTISNLTIIGSNGYCGLFTTIVKPKIKNITLRNTTLKYAGSGDIEIAPLICRVNGATRISNCNIDSVSYNITGQTANAIFGGLIAYNNAVITIDSCTVSIQPEITPTNGSIYFGGIIGDATNNLFTVSNCSVNNNTLSITNNSALYYGGLIGRVTYTTATIKNSQWNGNNIYLSSNSSTIYAGGMIGRIAGTGYINATLSHVTGSLSISGTAKKKYGYYLGHWVMKQSESSSFHDCSHSISVNDTLVTNYTGE